MSQNKLDSISSIVYQRFGILLLIVGSMYGLDTYLKLNVATRLWPIIITILGIGFLGIFSKRGQKESSYLGIGIYLICFSGLALYCNFTSWSALVKYWPCFILFLGFSFSFAFLFDKSKRLLFLMGLLLISLSVVFFFVFSISSSLWWTVFILTGLSVLIGERVK
jgi:hypothetical protein